MTVGRILGICLLPLALFAVAVGVVLMLIATINALITARHATPNAPIPRDPPPPSKPGGNP